MLTFFHKSTNDRQILIPCDIALLKRDPKYVSDAAIWLSAADRGKAMVTFQQAYEAAAARNAPEVWADLSPDLRVKAIRGDAAPGF